MKLLPLLTVAIVAVPGAAIAACDDYPSYWITSSGLCVDLTSFSELGAAQAAVEQARKEALPIVFENVRVEEEGRFRYLVGATVNRSQQPIVVYGFTVRFTTRVGGTERVVGDENISVNDRVEPGARVPFRRLLSNDSLVGKPVVLLNTVRGSRL